MPRYTRLDQPDEEGGGARSEGLNEKSVWVFWDHSDSSDYIEGYQKRAQWESGSSDLRIGC